MPEANPRARDAQDPIKNVALLQLENRSFDQMLGCDKETYAELEGIDPNEPPPTNRQTNRDDRDTFPANSARCVIDEARLVQESAGEMFS